MRTQIEINDKLLAKAMRAAKAPTKQAVVDEALRLLVSIKGQSRILRLRGKVKWEGNLEQSRLSRTFD